MLISIHKNFPQKFLSEIPKINRGKPKNIKLTLIYDKTLDFLYNVCYNGISRYKPSKSGLG